MMSVCLFREPNYFLYDYVPQRERVIVIVSTPVSLCVGVWVTAHNYPVI